VQDARYLRHKNRKTFHLRSMSFRISLFEKGNVVCTSQKLVKDG